MHTLIQVLPARELLARQAPALLASLLVAEQFYKFHSFSLECLAFLATWYVIDAGVTGIAAIIAGRRTRA